ncbi:MAG: hypothetical protein Q9184_006317 [Pyrenodesmia sp. 2 TL-2023]
MAHPMSPPYGYNEENDDLTLEDEEVLAEQSIVVRKSQGGKRKISAAFLTPPSSHGSRSSSSSSSSTSTTASIRVESVSQSTATVDVPDHLESQATLEICGFTPEAASKIYARWAGRASPESNPDDLSDYMRADIVSADPHGLLGPWDALRRMGIKQKVQDAIMDPRHENIRETETVAFWALDTVTVNWKNICHFQQTLKTVAVTLKSKKKRKAQVQDLFPHAQPPGAVPQLPTATVQSPLDNYSEFHILPKAHVAIADSPPVDLPEHYTLWKAKAAVEMSDWIGDDGSLSRAGLQTLPGGDFNSVDIAYYWTLERGTAQQYWDYAITRLPDAEMWMIRVQVSKTFIDSLPTQQLWFSPNWKEYVWYGRKRLQPPPKFNDHERSALIKGHICRKMSRIITRIKIQDVQTTMNEDNLLFIDGLKATQWAIKGANNQTNFDREIKGKIHIVITPPTNTDNSKE